MIRNVVVEFFFTTPQTEIYDKSDNFYSKFYDQKVITNYNIKDGFHTK